MTILTIAQNCAKRLQLRSPSALVSSTDNNMILLKTIIERTAQEIRNSYLWPELTKEYTFTLSTSTANYQLPTDFDRHHMETLWNRTQHWPLIGPIDSVLWQQYKSGLVTTLPRQRFRIKTWQDNQFFIDPTPTSSENGQTIAFEFISRSWLRPTTVWAALQPVTINQYRYYNGNIYQAGSTGTTGTVAPTHLNGTVSDGSINFTYVLYETITVDTDECILDNEMITDGAVWRFKQERGLDFEDLRAQAETQLEQAKTRLQGAGVIPIQRTQGVFTPMIGPWSYPDGNYGL